MFSIFQHHFHSIGIVGFGAVGVNGFHLIFECAVLCQILHGVERVGDAGDFTLHAVASFHSHLARSRLGIACTASIHLHIGEQHTLFGGKVFNFHLIHTFGSALKHHGIGGSIFLQSHGFCFKCIAFCVEHADFHFHAGVGTVRGGFCHYGGHTC